MTPRRTLIHAAGAAALAGALALPVPVAAQPAWPTRPVRILVGFPPGSTPDMSARAIAEPLARILGQPVVVENKPGASGNIATDQVAKATDDHTLGVVINGNLTSSKMLYRDLPYDPAKDFAYLSLLTTAPLVLVARADAPDGAAFLAAARKDGDRWNYGSVGAGSVAHLGMELLKSRAGDFKAVHVPYKGNPQVVTAMIGGEIQMALVPPGIAMPQVNAGKLKAIGLTSGRSALVPNVPPLADAGLKDFNLEVWTALVGPARLSKAARDRLSAEVPALVRDPAVRQRLISVGWQPVGTSPDGLKSRVEDEARILGDIIRGAGISLR